jgi:NAD(P)H-dependent FMN reductase
MTRILGLSGSLRAGSFNTALLRAAAALMPAGASLDVVTLHGIPLYDGDAEARDGIPAAVAALKPARRRQRRAVDRHARVQQRHARRAEEWHRLASRPSADIARVFGQRHVAVIGASPGGFGTILAQNAWLPVLRTLGVQPWFGGRLMVSRAGKVFDEGGAMVDEKMKAQLQQFLQGFVTAIQRQAP